jgi:hypothetical protein
MISRVFPAFSARSLGLLLAAFPLLAACASHPGVETQKLPDGTLRLKCQDSLAGCLARAEDICHGNTYEVIRARDQRDRYGPELGTAQVEVRSSEAYIRCGSHGRPFGGYDELKLPPRPPEPATAEAGAAPGAASPAAAGAAAAPTARACIPGSTQACIGPGKCEGGQSCLPDGSAFGPCDCGTLGPPVTAPSASGTATPAPAPASPGPPGAPPVPPPAPTYKPQNPPAQPLKAAPAPKH